MQDVVLGVISGKDFEVDNVAWVQSYRSRQ
jgi:hypothetical protein